MVFLTLARFMPRLTSRALDGSKPNRGADSFWRKQQIFRFAWKFRGRARNCYSVAVRAVHRSLRYATRFRKLKKLNMHRVWVMRLEAAGEEHGLGHHQLMAGLARSDIQLDRKVLAELAIYEPRTFESLCEVAKCKVHQEGLAGATTAPPKGVITRGML